jgi:single-stranded-DNA-specific exonuclease
MVRTTIREHRWTVADPPNAEIVARLASEINVPDPIARILVHRGIDDYDKAKAYFRPSMGLLEDPFLLGGMEVATERILTALRRNETMIVFGDYDVDGTNGAAMLYLFLKSQGANVTYYIPDRIKEGYGISRLGIDLAHGRNATLFLAIDCGITAVDQVDYATSLGMEVIICDHHETGQVLPRALAVLDPIKPDDPYPFKYLCGCGVGFKFIQGIAKKLGKEESVVPFIDFVTLASTADIVPLTGENRVLCKLGLEKINTNPRPGIKALIESAGLRPGQITAGQIVFVLAPRINAVGRLGDAMRAVRLLTSEDPAEAEDLARVLEEENRNRRKIDEDTFADAQLLAESVYDIDTASSLVIHQDHWHPGVVGIVASRMVEKYYKPAIMMATVDGVAKGSARSISGFDVYEALKRCEDKIIQFGGHKYAAGLTVEIARLEEFRKAFDDTVREMMTEELKTPELHIDVEIGLSDITPRFVRILREFAPFGPANMRPTFLARNIEVAGTPRVVGKNHLRMKLRQNGAIFDAIGFGLGSLLSRVNGARKPIDCVFTVEENDWVPPGGLRPQEPTTQLKIKDFR